LRFRTLMYVLSFQLAFFVLSFHASRAWIWLPFSPAVLFLETATGFETMASELTGEGIKASAPALIVGKSGVKHEFAFALLPDSGKVKIVVDTELSVKEVDEMKVLKFYVKVFDTGPEKAVLCVSPKLSERASALAKEYQLVILENEVPKKLIPMASELVRGMVEKK